MMRVYAAVLLFLFVGHLDAQAYFDDPDDLVSAVNRSTDGGTFIVSDGTYRDFEATVQVVGTADKPVIIKAETVGGVTLTGESKFVLKKSAHVVLQGFVFDAKGDETLVKLEGCNHIRITRNVFELETSESIKWVFIGGVWNDNVFPFEYPSHHNRIDHNTFQNKTSPGHFITVDGSNDATGSTKVYYQSTNDTIDHNYFRNNGPRAVNGQESIRVGWSQMSLSSGHTILERNLFEDCDGDPEIISVKTCDNVIRHNTFIASYGTLSLRHGNRNRVEGNYFFGDDKPISVSATGSLLQTGGIRIYGTDHLIINNYMEGLTGTRWDAPITLTQGDAIDGESSSLSKHFRAERVTIAYNTLVNNSHGIEIGFDNANRYNKGLKDITIANNLITGSENSLVAIVDPNNDQGDEITWSNNLMYPTGEASLLTGATTTTFDETAVVNLDPNLTFDEYLGIWRSTQNTPTFDLTNGMDPVAQDIDGHARTSPSTVGADHYSLESIRYPPLTPADVGPNAYEESTTSTSPETTVSTINAYPIPANNVLQLDNLDIRTTRIDILNLNGQIVLSTNLPRTAGAANLNTALLPNGIYVLTAFNGPQLLQSKKIVIHH
ncbi:hypothetical protein A3850_011870 [Lewinella sp. 4G2]|nr:hypothetical protein A3850_011870 [Lewinella sp. 4G2]